MTPLAQQVALVTGGSRGIGRAVCLELARLGATVVVNYHAKGTAADEVVGQVKQSGGSAEAVQADVTSEDAVSAMLDHIKSTYGRLDILVNNAGILHDVPLPFMKLEHWRQVVSVSLDGAFLVTKAAARLMMKTRGSRVVNMSSVAGLIGAANRANYCAAKAGLVGLTKAAARDLASFGIRVNAVCPGLVDTELIAEMKDASKKLTIERTPLGRIGTPDDVAQAVAFLVGPESNFITGELLVVDGGLSL